MYVLFVNDAIFKVVSTTTYISKYSEVRPVMGLGKLSASELCLHNRLLVSKVLKLLLGRFKMIFLFCSCHQVHKVSGRLKTAIFFKSAILSYIDVKDWQALIWTVFRLIHVTTGL